MKLSEAFRRGAAIISEPGKWRQDGKYGYCPWDHDDGYYCVIGAAAKAAGESPGALVALEQFQGPLLRLNDAPDTTQEDAVMASLFIAEYLEGEGQ